MKTKVDTAPETGGIKNALPKIDFADTFSTTNHEDSLDKVAVLIFGSVPTWVASMLKFRNFLVRSIGLKTEVPEDDNMGFIVGGHIGFFEIHSIQENEIVLGADDKHLNFRVSIYNSGEPTFNIKITTLVEYNNLFGKIYMSVIKPFHYVVMRAMVKQAYKG